MHQTAGCQPQGVVSLPSGVWLVGLEPMFVVCPPSCGVTKGSSPGIISPALCGMAGAGGRHVRRSLFSW